MSPPRQIACDGFCTALHDQCPENPFWPVSGRKRLDPNRPIMADHRRTDSRELRRLYTQVRIFGHTNVSITRNVGPDCRTGVSICGGFTRFRRRCGSGSGLPNGEGWWAAMPSSGSTGKPSPPSVRRGRMPPRAIRAGTRDRNHLIPLRGRAIISHQHEKTRRIRFVTPTKLPYPWNLMS